MMTKGWTAPNIVYGIDVQCTDTMVALGKDIAKSRLGRPTFSKVSFFKPATLFR